MITENCNDRFQVGQVYVATPAIKGQPRKLAAVLEIDGSKLLVGFVDELATGRVKVFEGRDFALVETGIGQYNISACVKAAAREAEIVNEILRTQRERTGGDDDGV